MSGFDEWFSKFENTDFDSYDIGYLAWNEQQKKIDAIKQHLESFYAEAELWGFESDTALHQLDLIEELLKCGKT